MHSAEAIVAINCYRIDCLTLAVYSEQSTLFQLHVDIDEFFDADELVKAQILISNLVLIVLSHSCRVNSFGDDAKRT